MSLCIALLSGPLDHKAIEHWFTTDHFAPYILHVEQLRNVDPSSGQLCADPFGIPSGIDPRDICGLAIFDCETKEVDIRYAFQLPAQGISCLSDQNVLCLRGWCDDPETVEEYVSDCSILDDPCALHKELRCCYLKLIKEREKVSISFRDRNVRFQPKSEADKVRLFEMMMQADADCNCNSDWRGGRIRHSCANRSVKPRRRAC